MGQADVENSGEANTVWYKADYLNGLLTASNLIEANSIRPAFFSKGCGSYHLSRPKKLIGRWGKR